MEYDRNRGASMSACSVSKQSGRLSVGVMTIRPNLDELLAQFVTAHGLYSPKKPLDADPKRKLEHTMHDLGLDDISDLYEYLFSNYFEALKNELDRSVLKDLCDFIK